MIRGSVLLNKTHIHLGWPTPEEITHPKGAGASVFASLARNKIGGALTNLHDANGAMVGVLTSDPESNATEPLIAVVVAFEGEASEITLRELHRLAWNFSHSPTLITIEPGLLRLWTCCEAPNPNRPFQEFLVHQLSYSDVSSEVRASLESKAVQALHWINLVSGEFFRLHTERFNRNGRADHLLLDNLRYIRGELKEAGLDDDDICHDLLARIIFVQFLFDRKDSDGSAALNSIKLGRLHEEGVLSKIYTSFSEILENYKDTYSLFDWLNARFNGDLFPGKGNSAALRAKGWAREKQVVKKKHLNLLADFIRGDVDMPSGQGYLWPQYSFDIIPLEFISSIYETFVSDRAAKEGIYYTPPHLVDFVLDRVLPWNSQNWNLTILDPACGSGVFLVKAFQRLVHRWKLANPGQQIRAETLRRLLQRNVFGVDKDPHAVRVACFSLYLAMCDEIEPRHYWTQVVFPAMRGNRLICADFFDENYDGFRSKSDSGNYDLIIGNAPWGDNLVTKSALKWAGTSEDKWPVPNKDIGVLFLPKAACLLRASGQVAMIQSANSLLFNGSSPAVKFRKKLFLTFKVKEIFNLSALRFKVFKRKSKATKLSVAPICIIVLSSDKPLEDDEIKYIVPKRLDQVASEFSIIVEPQDRCSLTVREAVYDLTVWTELMWGNHRDRRLLGYLKTFPSLTSLEEANKVNTREGIIFGDRGKFQPKIKKQRIFKDKKFPDGSLFYLDAERLPKLAESEARTDSRTSTDFSAFAWPQLIVKQGWQKSTGRFQARLTRSSLHEAVFCTQSYITVHAKNHFLEAAYLSLNSMIATYFLLLTSGRFAAYRPEPLVKDLLSVPIPSVDKGLLKGIGDQAAIDARMFEALKLKDAEKVLVEDLFNYTLPDFRGDENSPGRQPTSSIGEDELLLREYCKYFIRVIKAGFGHDKTIAATIFQEDANAALPFRLVAFELGRPADREVKTSKIGSAALLGELEKLDTSKGNTSSRRGIYNERVVRIYDSSNGVPTIFVVKPDMVRYWTRSIGLSDADEVALDLFRWRQVAKQGEALN